MIFIQHKEAKPFKPRIKEKTWTLSKERVLLEKWQNEQLFKFDENSKKPLFSIDTPPPYVNTPVHIGHAYTYAWMDMFARYRRMSGFNVLFPIGLDKNGLPVEVQTEKAFNIFMYETPREEFIEKCMQILKESGDSSLETFKRLGLSCTSWEVEHKVGGRYETDDPEYRKLTQETFIKFWEKDLIYIDEKPTNYCPVCRTSISDAEVEYEEKKVMLNHIKFKVKETNEDIIIATTRPELICSCRIILFNPEDERYTHLKGRRAIVPIYDLVVKILPHPYAKPEFGSGLVMMCSYGDYNDVRLLRELNIDPIFAIDETGRMNEKAGKYKGLTVKEAREAIIKDLRDNGLLVKADETLQRRPVCWRSKNPIEFVSMKEFYLKQVEFKDEIFRIADQIKFFAPESKQILTDWINSVNVDWVISRRRYYGTEIPLWYCKRCNYVFVPKPGKYYQPWKEKPPIKKCPKCGNNQFKGEERTFDTWFDSSVSEIYILGYLWNKKFFYENFPCTLRPQGKEIVRNWLYFTLLKAYLFFGVTPFKNSWIHMHIVDEKGEKMSKSKGNIIDPQDVLEKHGAEAFRIWSCLEGNITKGDVRCSNERIRGTAKFLTKLWNIARYISTFPKVNKSYELAALDKLIIAECNELIKRCRSGYEQLNMYIPANAIRAFTWNVFADHYIEAVKSRAYNHNGDFDERMQRGAWYTLHTCLKNVLKLLAPICPFITETLWLALYSKKSIHVQPFPTAKLEWENSFIEVTPQFMNFNTTMWKYKKERALSLSKELKVIVNAPKSLEPFKEDLEAMHRIQRLSFLEPESKEMTKAHRLNEDIFVIE